MWIVRWRRQTLANIAFYGLFAGNATPIRIQSVMFFNKISGGHHHFYSYDFQADTLEASDDFTDEAALDAVRFDDYKSAFVFRMGLHVRIYHTGQNLLRQNLRIPLRNQNRMLKMCRGQTVGRNDGVIIIADKDILVTEVEHWFDGNSHARL